MSHYQRAIPAAMLGLGMVLSGGGCSAHEREPYFSSSVSSPEGQPTYANGPITSTTPEARSTYMPKQEKLLRLLGSNAAFNVIYISVSNALPAESVYSQKMNEEFRSKLVQSDPGLLAGFTDAFDRATFGRYHPNNVKVTIAPAITLVNGCIDIKNVLETMKVDNVAVSSSAKDAVNLVALDALPCKSGAEFSGYGSTNITPVINRGAFGISNYSKIQPFAKVAVHETGHAAGLDHAGKADCAVPATLTACTVDVTGDQNSIMSYATTSPTYTVAERFTAAELDIMGLLQPSEVVVNPVPGTVTLVPMDKVGTKLIVVQEPGGKPRYISYGEDPFAAYDIACDPMTKSSKKKNILYSTQMGDNKSYLCYKSDETGMTASVQVRYPIRSSDVISKQGIAGPESTVMVDARIDSKDQYDPRDDARVADGYTTPNTLIFSNRTSTYTFTSVNAAGEAIIAIDTTLPKTALPS